MANRIIIQDNQWHYFKVKLEETIGEGPGAVNIGVWVRHIWAHDEQEACKKAIVFQMKRIRGSLPHIQQVALEDYDQVPNLL